MRLGRCRNAWRNILQRADGLAPDENACGPPATAPRPRRGAARPSGAPPRAAAPNIRTMKLSMSPWRAPARVGCEVDGGGALFFGCVAATFTPSYVDCAAEDIQSGWGLSAVARSPAGPRGRSCTSASVSAGGHASQGGHAPHLFAIASFKRHLAGVAHAVSATGIRNAARGVESRAPTRC